MENFHFQLFTISISPQKHHAKSIAPVGQDPPWWIFDAVGTGAFYL
jgi:hypothetical protein